MQVFAKEAAGQWGRKHDGGAEAGADVSRLARGSDQAAREGRAQGRLVGPVDRAGRVGERGARVAALGPAATAMPLGRGAPEGPAIGVAEETFGGRCDSVTDVLRMKTPKVSAAAS